MCVSSRKFSGRLDCQIISVLGDGGGFHEAQNSDSVINTANEAFSLQFSCTIVPQMYILLFAVRYKLNLSVSSWFTVALQNRSNLWDLCHKKIFLRRYSILFSLATLGFFYRLRRRDTSSPDTSSRLPLCGLWTEEINRALTNRELAVMVSRSSSRSDKSKSRGWESRRP